MAGQRAHVSLRRHAFREAADLLRRDGEAPYVGIAAQDRGDLRFALLRLKRAYAVDDRPARPRQRDGLVDELGLQLDQRSEISRPLDPSNVGMAADGAG